MSYEDLDSKLFETIGFVNDDEALVWKDKGASICLDSTSGLDVMANRSETTGAESISVGEISVEVVRRY